MSLQQKLIDMILPRILEHCTAKVGEILKKAVYEAEDHAKTTKNNIDDMIVDWLKKELNIPDREE